MLRSYWEALFDAQELFAEYARQRATATGLFFDDQYWFSPLPSIYSTGARLWELTHDTTYIELSLLAAEKSRRDSWNTTQAFREKCRPMDAPPENLLGIIQKQLGSNEGVLLCAHNNLAGQKEMIVLLAISPDTVAFISRDLPFSLRNTAHLDHKPMRVYLDDYHALYKDVYVPVASVLRHASRVRVFPSGDAAFIAFDALLADTNSKGLQTADLLVQRHAFVYPTKVDNRGKIIFLNICRECPVHRNHPWSRSFDGSETHAWCHTHVGRGRRAGHRVQRNRLSAQAPQCDAGLYRWPLCRKPLERS
ncbi:MAG: hypothetical protein R2811_06885 [Flavobacteriales bacterium]